MIRTDYDKKYQNPNFFSYQRWMFGPYVRTLIKKYNIQRQSFILDVGCGSGFFSQLFYDEGMNVVGIDLSAVGVRAARAMRQDQMDFIIGDGVNALPFKQESFDLIFCRGFSPYNLKDFRTRSELSTRLFKYLRKGGIFIFACSTDLSGLPNGRKRLVGKTSSTWINLTLNDIEEHFSRIDSVRLLNLYFLNRLELACLGQYGLNPFFNHLNSFLVKATSIRGEAICALQKQ